MNEESGSTLKALLRSCAALAAVLALAACDTAQSTAPGTAQPIMFSLDEDMMCTTGDGALGGLSASIMSSSDLEAGTDASSGVSSEIYGMNKDGWASGRVRSGGKWVPAVRNPDGTWLVVTVDAAYTTATLYDINDNNDFVGYIVLAGAPSLTDVSYWRAIRGTVVAAAAVQISLPAGGSEARSINNTGVVAGTVFQAGEPSQVFRHNGSTYALLERSENAKAYGINSAGHIVGSVSEGTTSGFGFYHNGSQFIDIEGDSLIARGVNDAGEVVGELKVGSVVRAFIATVTGTSVSPPKLIPLAGVAVQNYAYAINNSGEVVGFDRNATGGRSAWRWDSRTPGATPVRLDKLASGCGARAFAINECGVAGGLTERTGGLLPLATLWGSCTFTPVLTPAISLVKLTNGTDNNSPTGPVVPEGSTVTWTYDVANTGNVTLTNIVVRDDNGTPLNTADDFTVCTIASLAAGESQTCTATGTATAGQYGNWGTASTTYGGSTISATDPDHYFGQAGATLLIIDEDGIDNGLHLNRTGGGITPSGPSFWTVREVNDDIAAYGLRSVLRYFADSGNFGRTITVRTGQTGDEGWFAPSCIPRKWLGSSAGSTDNRCLEGAERDAAINNFFFSGQPPFTGTNSSWALPQNRLDKIPHVIPLRARGLVSLVGKDVCAVVYDSDISINYDHGTSLGVNGNLQGATLGIAAFRVNAVRTLNNFSSSTLPEVQVTVLNPAEACRSFKLFNPPVPNSSSVPNDRVVANLAGTGSNGYRSLLQWPTLPTFF
jgi:hypothetical protein